MQLTTNPPPAIDSPVLTLSSALLGKRQKKDKTKHKKNKKHKMEFRKPYVLQWISGFGKQKSKESFRHSLMFKV